MTDRTEADAKAIEFFRTIDSLDDLKEKWNKYLEHNSAIMRSGVDEVKEFASKADGLSTEEKAENLARFLDDNYMFSPEVQAELQRIDELPGVAEYIESRSEEFESLMSGYFQEFQETLQPVADEVLGGAMNTMMDAMGDMLGGLGEAMAEGMGGMMEGFEGEEGQKGLVAEDDRVNELWYLYEVTSLEGLKEQRQDLFPTVYDQLAEDLENLKIIKEMQVPVEDELERIESFNFRRTVWLAAVNNELDRIAGIPGCGEEAAEAKNEFNERTVPLADEMRLLENELLKHVKPPEE